MPKPKSIINDPAQAVQEFIDGLLLQYPNHMARLQHNANVVIYNKSKQDVKEQQEQGHIDVTNNNAPIQQQRVQLISGGGSGHEPSHAGWLGHGMLSAAVCGGMFASPSSTAVLAAIRAVHTMNHPTVSAAAGSGDGSGEGSSGVLLVVKNYTGDRLNFGMAAEHANLQGIPCEMVVVADDCALPRTKGITGARGVAGTVLVHKIAGAAAARGYDLSHVAAIARTVCQNMGTLGVALDAVTVPGAEHVNDRLQEERTMEFGLGIHGEAGMRQAPLMPANSIAQELITGIQSHGRVVKKKGDNEAEEDQVVPMFQSGDQVCVLVNNLGGTSNFEMSILARACITALESAEFGVRVTHAYVGSYMTSFNMHGASLTILNLQGQSELIQLLEAETDAPAWKPCDVWHPQASDSQRPSATAVTEDVAADSPESSAATSTPLPPVHMADFGTVARTLTTAAAQKLVDSEPLLTQYDTIVGDGDCGITMKRGALQVLQGLQDNMVTTDHPVTLLAGIATAVSASMGGTSGILLELFFRKMASTLRRCSNDQGITTADVYRAVQAGVDAVQLYGGATAGSRTMLDALIPLARALQSNTADALTAAAQAARQGADRTADMAQASAGRSNYLSQETLKGTPDPGAVAVALVMEAMAAAMSSS